MKLLDIIEMDEKDITIDVLEEVIFCLEDRLEWLSCREPESEGEVYDEWDMKYSDLDSLKDDFDDCLQIKKDTTKSNKKYIKRLKEAIEKLDDYQDEYGGLSRLKIYP